MSYLKAIFKFFVSIFSYIIAYYYIGLIHFRIPFRTIAISVSKYNGYLGVKIRQVFYKYSLRDFGKDVIIAKGSYIVYRESEIGNNVAIEEDCVVSLCKIGNDVILAHRVSLMSGGNQHDVDDLSLNFRDSIMPLKKITIGPNVWIGVHSVIMEDISSGTAVAAGAVVTKKYEKDAIIGGVPAKVIRMRGACE